MYSYISVTRLGALSLLTVLVVGAILRFLRDRGERKGRPLPSGPVPLPLLGSVLSIDSKEPWLTYTQWRATYGDIVYARLLDTDMIVLNSPSIATDLLSKRAHIYSDRPFIATVKPFGHGCNFAFSGYTDHWRLCRRIFHQTFRAEASLMFRPMQLRRARQMIVNIMDDPLEYSFHYSTFAAAVAMSSVYDYEPKPQNDPMVSAIDSFLQVSLPSLTAERATLVKVFPFLLRVPDWLPGSWMSRDAREASRLEKKVIEMPYQNVQQRMESKEHINDTMVYSHINRLNTMDGSQRDEYEAALKHASISAFIGAAETTSTTIMTFTLAMVKHPWAWKRAQEDIDAVVGIDRLPEFEDRDSLPYVDAILRETIRWHPQGPLGIPHATTESDIYDGYYIPKGATVVANVWAMLQDKVRYPDPDVFRPERFLDGQGRLIEDNPADLMFGFGRRVCPGRHRADASVWSAMATMLATLEFGPGKDEDGKDIVFEAEFRTGITHRPQTFPCSLVPRAHMSKEKLV